MAIRKKLQWTMRALLVLSLAGLHGCKQNDAQAQDRARQAVQERLGEAPASIDTVTAAQLSSTFRGAASRALPAVVYVRVVTAAEDGGTQRGFRIPLPFDFDNGPDEDPELQRGEGSGFIYDPDGLIITNRHVVRNAVEVTVQLVDGRVFDAEVLGTDPNTDVAVLKIAGDGDALPAATLGDSDRLQVGDWVLALGNPLGLQFTVTAGIVSAKGRNINILNREAGNTAVESFIQTDAAINRGNSGGPLVDLAGRVVGVNTAIFSPTGFSAGNGFAIPVALVARVARDLVEHGVVRRPRIGVAINDVAEADAELYALDRIAGAVITQVQPDGPAADAGMRLGDVVLSVDGDPIDDSTDLITTLARRDPGEHVTLQVQREGRAQDLELRLGEFDVEPRVERRVAARPSSQERLGFRVESITPQAASRLEVDEGQGVVVTEVNPFGPAVNMVFERTVILQINGQPISTPRDVERIARELKRGDIVSVVWTTPGPDPQPTLRNYRIR